MADEIDKEQERKLLVKRIFPTPYAGYKDSLALFEICRDLEDPYSLGFNEDGHTPDYKGFDSETVVERASKLLINARLNHYVDKYRDKLNEWNSFKGKYYTYNPKTKTLKLESEWAKLETGLDELYSEYGVGLKAVLRAVWEVNVKLSKKWDNYWMIHMLAKKYGLDKGWFRNLSRLELVGAKQLSAEMVGVVDWHKGSISIPEELIPLVEKVLRKWGK